MKIEFNEPSVEYTYESMKNRMFVVRRKGTSTFQLAIVAGFSVGTYEKGVLLLKSDGDQTMTYAHYKWLMDEYHIIREVTHLSV